MFSPKTCGHRSKRERGGGGLGLTHHVPSSTEYIKRNYPGGQVPTLGNMKLGRAVQGVRDVGKNFVEIRSSFGTVLLFCTLFDQQNRNNEHNERLTKHNNTQTHTTALETHTAQNTHKVTRYINRPPGVAHHLPEHGEVVLVQAEVQPRGTPHHHVVAHDPVALFPPHTRNHGPPRLERVRKWMKTIGGRTTRDKKYIYEAL